MNALVEVLAVGIAVVLFLFSLLFGTAIVLATGASLLVIIFDWIDDPRLTLTESIYRQGQWVNSLFRRII